MGEEHGTATAVETGTTKKHSHKHFTVIYVVVAIALVAASFRFFNPETGPAYGAAIRISAVGVQSVAVWLVSFFGFVYGLNHMDYDVYKEIVKDQNTALSILIAGAGIAMAICLHG